MSSKSPAPSAPGGRKVLPIRPAVPLIYEPRPRGGGRASDEEKSVSNSSSKNGSNEGVEKEEVPARAQDVHEQSSKRAGPKLDDKQFLQSREEVGDVSIQIRNAMKHEIKEMKQDLLDISQHMVGDLEEGSEQLQRTKASTSESEWSTTGGSSRRLILGVEVEEPAHPMEQEKNPSQAAPSQNSSSRVKASSEEISANPSRSAKSNSESTGILPPVTYPAPYIQFGGYVNGIPPQPLYDNQYPAPSYDPQAQSRFMQAWNGVPQFNPLGGQPPPTPSSASLDDGNSPFDPKLAGHISSNFNVERYADIRLVVTHEQGRFEETTFFLHRVLVSRSETLRGLLDEYAGNYDENDGKLVIKMKLNDRFITLTALAYALQTCYGQPASNFPPCKSRGGAERHRDQSIANMLEILAFAATGHLLKLEDVALRGIEKAQEALNWDTLECALSFGMESCTHRRESPEALLLKSFSYSTPEGDLFSVDCATFMLDLSLSFMASSIPDSWILVPSARRLPIVDRLPVTSELPRSSVKSKLASIQFGQLPPEMDPKIVDYDALISSVVLSVPFANLCHIAAKKATSITRQLPQIIEERERRRLATLNSEAHWNQRRLGKETEWHAVGFQESHTQTDLNDRALGLSYAPVSIYSNPTDEEEAKKRDQAGRGLVQNPLGSDS